MLPNFYTTFDKFINLKRHKMQAPKFFPHASTAANDDDEITKHFIQITSDQLPEWRVYSGVLPERILRFPRSFAARWFIAIFVPWFFTALKLAPHSLVPVFADYSSHIASTIFAKYRMITRKGNMSIFMYDYYFLFYLIAGWIIMLKNGKRESLNSFKKLQDLSFFHCTKA